MIESYSELVRPTIRRASSRSIWYPAAMPPGEGMVEALRRKGNHVGYFLFAGEQHGYAVNIFDSDLTF